MANDGSRRGNARAWYAALPALLTIVVLTLSACQYSSDAASTAPAAGSTDAPTTTELAPAPVTIQPDGGKDVTPVAPITVTVPGRTLTDVSVRNVATGVTVDGALSSDESTWRIGEPLGYGNRYRVVVHSAGPDGDRERTTGMITTLTPADTFEANLIPAPSLVHGSGIGVGQPIVFQFTKPVQNRARIERQLSVVTEPEQQGSWYWMDSQNVHYRPKHFWQPGTEITVKGMIYGVDLGGGVFGGSDTIDRYRVHDSWIARADGKSHLVRVYHNGKLVKTMRASLGKRSTPTHRGIHVISERHKKYLMTSCSYGVCDKKDPDFYRTVARWSSRISNDGEFVHENPATVGVQGEQNVSHGCINLNGADAKWFYNHLSYGDVVIVTRSGGPKLPVWDLYGDWSLSWRAWLEGSALS